MIGQRTPDPLAVRCPLCNAAPGRPCTTRNGRGRPARTEHLARLEAAAPDGGRRGD